MTPSRLLGITRVLCLGAHCDDIEIGCGGTILALVDAVPRLDVRWVVFSSDAVRKAEARASAARFLRAVARADVAVHDFRDGYLPYEGAAIKDAFERLKDGPSPDLVLTPWRHDAHQDHRLIGELTWNTFRDHTILEYEIPKYEGDFGSPNVLVPLDEEVCREKVDHIVQCFKSQATKPWFSADLFTSVMRVRGMEARAATGYAEGFYGRKLVVALGGPS
jgi:LmbE family N-acetylglucosaminyl deacetylase